MTDMDPATLRELLRRMVLKSRNDYSDTIEGLLSTLGFGVSWAKVDGNVLRAYIGGDRRPPKWAKDLTKLLGGEVGQTSNGRAESYYVWTWEAEV